MDNDHFEKGAHPNTPGAVLEPMEEGSGIDGGWARRERVKKLGKLAIVAAIAAPIAVWRMRNRAKSAGDIELERAA
jgi:hypothetical protein